MSALVPHLQFNQDAVGIDISDLVLRAVTLKHHGRRFTLQSFQELLLPPGLIVDGEILSPQTIAMKIRTLLQHAAPSGIRRRYAIACLPDRKTFVKLIQIPASSTVPSADVIREQMMQHIPFTADDIFFDWQTIGPAHNGSQAVLIGAAPKPLVASYIETLELTGLTIQALEMESLSISRAILPDPFPEEPLLIVDLGGTRTTVIVTAQRTIQFSSSLPFSGSTLTQRLAQAQHLTIDDAEKLKCLYGLDATKAKGTVTKVLRTAMQELAESLKEHLTFFENHFAGARPVTRIVLTGGGAQMPNLQAGFGTLMRLPVTLGNPLQRIVGRPRIPATRLPSFTTALGLALRTV